MFHSVEHKWFDTCESTPTPPITEYLQRYQWFTDKIDFDTVATSQFGTMELFFHNWYGREMFDSVHSIFIAGSSFGKFLNFAYIGFILKNETVRYRFRHSVRLCHCGRVFFKGSVKLIYGLVPVPRSPGHFWGHVPGTCHRDMSPGHVPGTCVRTIK